MDNRYEQLQLLAKEAFPTSLQLYWFFQASLLESGNGVTEDDFLTARNIRGLIDTQEALFVEASHVLNSEDASAIAIFKMHLEAISKLEGFTPEIIEALVAMAIDTLAEALGAIQSEQLAALLQILQQAGQLDVALSALDSSVERSLQS